MNNIDLVLCNSWFPFSTDEEMLHPRLRPIASISCVLHTSFCKDIPRYTADSSLLWQFPSQGEVVAVGAVLQNPLCYWYNYLLSFSTKKCVDRNLILNWVIVAWVYNSIHLSTAASLYNMQRCKSLTMFFSNWAKERKQHRSDQPAYGNRDAICRWTKQTRSKLWPIHILYAKSVWGSDGYVRHLCSNPMAKESWHNYRNICNFPLDAYVI